MGPFFNHEFLRLLFKLLIFIALSLKIAWQTRHWSSKLWNLFFWEKTSKKIKFSKIYLIIPLRQKKKYIRLKLAKVNN